MPGAILPTIEVCPESRVPLNTLPVNCGCSICSGLVLRLISVSFGGFFNVRAMPTVRFIKLATLPFKWLG